MENPTNLKPNAVEAAVQALQDQKDGVHASPDALIKIITRLLKHHQVVLLKIYLAMSEAEDECDRELEQLRKLLNQEAQ
jgi:predicted component of type VI protein secretion system